MSTSVSKTNSCTSWCPYKCASSKVSKTAIVVASIAAVGLLGTVAHKLYKKYSNCSKPAVVTEEAQAPSEASSEAPSGPTATAAPTDV
jgi:uncharacterized membrane protein YebE (DUF533 family)